MQEQGLTDAVSCPCCEHFTNNPAMHNCRNVFLADADMAYRTGDHAKVRQIVELARTKGIDLLTKSEDEKGGKA